MEKTVKKYLLVLFVICLAVSACASSSNSPSIVGTWKLTAYGSASSPSPAVADTEAGLTFQEDGTLTGHSGCNGLGGDYTVEGDQIIFGDIISTLMACEDPIMTQEGTFHQVMADTASFKIEGNMLTITKDDTVLVFESVAAE
jgi:heat shock protein HslJ